MLTKHFIKNAQLDKNADDINNEQLNIITEEKKRVYEIILMLKSILIDAGEAVGGDGTGVSPMEALLGSLAGCMGIDIYMILKPYQDKMVSLVIDTNGERNEEKPKFFTSIHTTIKVEGEIPASRVWRAVNLSHDKYCSVAHSLKADLHYTVILNGEEVENKK